MVANRLTSSEWSKRYSTISWILAVLFLLAAGIILHVLTRVDKIKKMEVADHFLTHQLGIEVQGFSRNAYSDSCWEKTYGAKMVNPNIVTVEYSILCDGNPSKCFSADVQESTVTFVYISEYGRRFSGAFSKEEIIRRIIEYSGLSEQDSVFLGFDLDSSPLSSFQAFRIQAGVPCLEAGLWINFLGSDELKLLSFAILNPPKDILPEQVRDVRPTDCLELVARTLPTNTYVSPRLGPLEFLPELAWDPDLCRVYSFGNNEVGETTAVRGNTMRSRKCARLVNICAFPVLSGAYRGRLVGVLVLNSDLSVYGYRVFAPAELQAIVDYNSGRRISVDEAVSDIGATR